MTVSSSIDCLVVTGTFAAVYILLPAWVIGRSAPSVNFREWSRHAATGFVRSSLLFLAAALVLGKLKVWMAGSAAVTYLSWVLLTAVVRDAGPFGLVIARWQLRFLKTLSWLERPVRRSLRVRPIRFPRLARTDSVRPCLALLLGLAFWHSAAYALSNLRLQSVEAYSRLFAVQNLISGQGGNWEGSVALLAPVAFFSGADAASALRFGAVAFALMVPLAAAWCVYRFSGVAGAALLALAVTVLLGSIHSQGSPPQASGAEIAPAFWLLALAFLRMSWPDALFATAVALFLYPGIPPGMVLLLTAVAAIALAAWLARRWLSNSPTTDLACGAVAASLLLALCLDLPVRSDGPHQYESAARVASRIAGEFPRKEWLIISPTHELGYIGGRGWHEEISGWASSYEIDQVAAAEFRFPYQLEDVFVFVEKVPLGSAAGSGTRIHSLGGHLANGMDAAVYAYGTYPGRSSVQFKSARLMEAYARSHDNVSIYHEDGVLTVYRLRPMPPRLASASPP